MVMMDSAEAGMEGKGNQTQYLKRPCPITWEVLQLSICPGPLKKQHLGFSILEQRMFSLKYMSVVMTVRKPVIRCSYC